VQAARGRGRGHAVLVGRRESTQARAAPPRRSGRRASARPRVTEAGEQPRAQPRPGCVLPSAGEQPRRPGRAAAGPAEAGLRAAGRGQAAAPPAAGAGEPRRPGRAAAGPAEDGLRAAGRGRAAAPPAAGAGPRAQKARLGLRLRQVGPPRRAEHAVAERGHTHGRRRGGERERSRTSSSDGLAVADHDPGARGRGERWCASRRTTLLPLGLKSAGGEATPDGPSSGVGVGSR
jgi:hypothetical protein